MSGTTTQSSGFDARAVHATAMTTVEPFLVKLMTDPPKGARSIYCEDKNIDTNAYEQNVVAPPPALKKFTGQVGFDVMRSYSLKVTKERWDAALRVSADVARGGSQAIADTLGSFLSINGNYFEDVAFAALTAASGVGRTGYDGVPLFYASHPHGYQDATQSNTSTDALTYANLKAKHILMNSLRKANGQNYGIDPDTILCGPALQFTAEEIAGARGIIRAAALNAAGAEATASVVAAAGVSNVLAGRYNVVVDPRLATLGSGTVWYLIDSKAPKAIRCGAAAGSLQFVAKDQSEDDCYINLNEFHYHIIANVWDTAGAWQGISKHGS